MSTNVTTRRLVLPTIHRNGSGARRLAERYETTLIAIRKLLEELQAAVPNSRDYATDEEFIAAHEDHQHDVATLLDMAERKRAVARHCRKADER